MRRMMLVGALVAGGASTARAGTEEDAIAAWKDDYARIGGEFALPGRGDESEALAKELQLHDEPLPLDAAFYWFDPVDHHVTGTIDHDDSDLCRAGVLMAITRWREEELMDGRRAGFTYEVTCGTSVFTGRWGPFGTEDGFESEGYGELSMTQTQGDDHRDYKAEVHWSAVAPDVSDPPQWEDATLWLVDELEPELDRIDHTLQNPGNDCTNIEQKATDVLGEIDEQLARLDGFDVLTGGEKLLAAERKWLTATRKDLDTGDLHKYIARCATGTTPPKVYAKKLKALRKKWTKSRGKRGAALEKVVKAYEKAHP